ncbi:MAG: hypothetical protein IT385_18340 [Deltaproteobacteria bacterium]|nr:hypothetical protein [Deltaproteobacteria bacterium]
MRRNRPIALALASLLVACGDDGGDTGPTIEACDPDNTPVVMIHGFLEGGELWLPFAQRFEANGHCPSDIHAFTWDPLAGETAARVAALDAFIESVRADGEVVHLLGHAAGGELAYAYLADPARAAKVEAYCHIAATPYEGPAGPAESPVSTANIRSPADPVVAGGDIPGAANLVLTTEDHVQVATSDKAFNAVYQFLGAGKKPKTLDRADAPPGGTSPRTIAGRATTYGENAPLAGWTVDVWPLEDTTGARVGEAPASSLAVAADGGFGPFEAAAGTRYELHLRGPSASDVAVHHYRPAFAADARLVHLHASPTPDSLLRVVFSQIDRADAHAALIVQTAAQAVRHDRDALSVGARALSTEALAAPERSTTTFFVYDDEADGQSGGEIQQLANLFETRLAGVDEVIPAGGTVTVTLGDRALVVPARPSQSEGLVWVTFD